MKKINVVLVVVAVAVLAFVGCPQPQPGPSTQIVVLGDSFASGSEAVTEVNNIIGNAAGSGCKAVSVGGYGAGGEGLIIGVPVLLDCPLGTTLLPTGAPTP